MKLNRITGLTLGFGVGVIIAIVAFGIYWVSNNLNKNSLKTQALQIVPTNVPTTPASTLPSTTPDPSLQKSDTLLNRLAPAEDQVATDISESLKQLYGPKE
jgi:hypothetical protein